MTYAEFKKTIQTGEFGSLYLFTGPEEYLASLCADIVKKKLEISEGDDFNQFVFNDQTLQYEAAAEAIENYPVLADKKFVFFRNANLWKDKEHAEDWCALFSDLPDYVCVIIREKEPDRRSKLYKKIVAAGEVVEFAPSSPSDLKSWVVRLLAAEKKVISQRNLDYFMELCGSDMTNIKTQADKLISYLGDREEATEKDIDAVVTKPLSNRIFQIAEAVALGKKQEALAMIYELRALREPAAGIISIISSTFCELYRAALLSRENLSFKEMCDGQNLPPNRAFLAKKYLQTVKSVDLSKLRRLIAVCEQMDNDFKNGKIEEWLALETIILA